MELTTEQILQFIGPGPCAVLIVIAWKLLPLYRRHIKALERDIIIRRWQVQLLRSLARWLKGQGHNVKTPDLAQKI